MSRSIFFIQYTDPGAYPPLLHAAAILADRGWRAVMFGVSHPGTSPFPVPAHPNIRVRLSPRPASGWRHKLHFLGFHLRVLLHALLERPSWLYVSEALAAPSALLLGRLGFNVAFHEHDPPGYPDSRFMTFLLKCRRALAHAADFIVIPNQRRIEAFRAETGTTRPIHLVWNCPRRQEAEAQPRAHQSGPLRLYCHGSIVPGRVPVTVLDAIARCPHRVEFTLAGYDPGSGHLQTLRDEATRLGVADRFTFAGAIPERSALLDLAATHDAGFMFVPKSDADDDPWTLVGASNKVFDYMACGVVPIVTDLPEWEELVVKPGYGVSCDPRDPDSIAAVLDALAANPAARQRMAEAGRARILKDWNYETAFAPVLQALEGA